MLTLWQPSKNIVLAWHWGHGRFIKAYSNIRPFSLVACVCPVMIGKSSCLLSTYQMQGIVLNGFSSHLTGGRKGEASPH